MRLGILLFKFYNFINFAAIISPEKRCFEAHSWLASAFTRRPGVSFAPRQ